VNVEDVRGQVVRQAIRTLRRQIEDGTLGPGQILPAERPLCQSLNVSRMTLRGALAWLEREGVIERNHGRRQVAFSNGAAATAAVSETVAMVTKLQDPGVHPVQGDLLSIDSGAIEEAQKAGWHLLLLNPASLTRNQMRQLPRHAPQGVVIGGVTADYWMHREYFSEWIGRLPLAVNSDDPMWESCDRVVSDHENGAFALTQWLLGRGHRRILPLWRRPTDSTYWSRARLAGFRRAMREAGIKPLEPLVVPAPAPEEMPAAVEALFDYHRRLMAGHLIERLHGPAKADALMVISDTEALRAAAACQLLGVRPNEDVAIVGYDNFWPVSPERDLAPTVPLATVDKHNDQTGRELMRLLLDRIRGRLGPAPQLRLVPPTVMVTTDAAQQRRTAVSPAQLKDLPA